MSLEVDPHTKELLQREFIAAIRAEGLILVPEFVGEFSINFYKQQQRLLRRKVLTPYQIAKWALIPGVKSINSIKNMIADGRIKPGESYKDKQDKLCVMVHAVKRLRNE